MAYSKVILTGGSPWGFRVSGGKENGEPIKISKVLPYSKAFIGGLREGDYIVSINGLPVQDCLHTQIVKLLRDIKPEHSLSLQIKHSKQNFTPYSKRVMESPIINAIETPYKGKVELGSLSDCSNRPFTNGMSTTSYQSKPFSSSKENSHNFTPSGFQPHTTSTMSYSDSNKLPNVATSEIPDSNVQSGGGKSKGVNLFLARQKMIADMMEAEEEAEKAAEEEKKRLEEERIKREELERKRAEERRKFEEIRMREQEKLLESQKAAAARAAKFRPSKKMSEAEPEIKAKSSSSKPPSKHHVRFSEPIEDDDLKITESPPQSPINKTSSDDTKTDEFASDDIFGGSDFSTPQLNLPKSQPPTVTLLQKTRVSADSDMHKIKECLASQPDYISLQAGDIPKGAVYFGTNERIVSGYKHTDTFYLVPAESRATETTCSKINGNSQNDDDESGICNSHPAETEQQESTKEGRQETNEKINQSKQCYNDIYKKTHKVEKTVTAETNPYQPTYEFPDGQVQEDNQLVEDNSYTPTYKFPEKLSEDTDMNGNVSEVQSVETTEIVNEMNSIHADSVTNGSSTYKVLTVNTTIESDNPFTKDYDSPLEAESTSPLSPKLQYKEIQKGGDIPFSGLRKPAPITPPSRVAPPPPPRFHTTDSKVFRLKDRCDHSGVDKHDTVAIDVEKDTNSSQRSHSVPRDAYKHDALQREGNLRPSRKTVWCKNQRIATPSPVRRSNRAFLRNASVDRQIVRVHGGHLSSASSASSITSNASQLSNKRSLIIVPPKSGILSDKSLVQEGTIPRRVRSVSATQELNVTSSPAFMIKLKETPKYVPPPIAGYDRAPAPLPRELRDRNDAKRREIMTQVERDEKRKKALEEEAERRSRRHSDYFTIKDKSPIPHDRYDQTFFPSHSPARSVSSTNSPRSPRSYRPYRSVSETNQLSARVLYTFTAQHPRELAANKDDIIVIIRRVDANWYEASSDGRIGIIPVTYVCVIRESSLSPPPTRPEPPRLKEGSGVAKYSFNPQSPVELKLKKGDQVSLIRRVDSNWYEGRLHTSSRTGIFPVSYIQVISEPESFQASPSGTSPLINRSKSVPDGSIRQRPLLSPQQGSPLNRAPSSGYGSSDHLITNGMSKHNSKLNHNNNNISYSKSPNLNTTNRLTEESDAPVIRPFKGLEMPSYRSVYNYTPRNDDELELKEGDIVHVIEKCDDGWFVGTSGRTGMFGTFPGNYVTPILKS